MACNFFTLPLMAGTYEALLVFIKNQTNTLILNQQKQSLLISWQ
jgi:hypothetical protein